MLCLMAVLVIVTSRHVTSPGFGRPARTPCPSPCRWPSAQPAIAASHAVDRKRERVCMCEGGGGVRKGMMMVRGG